MSRDWAETSERGSYGALRFALFLLNIGGYWFGLFCGCVAVIYFFLTGRQSRAASRQYLTRVSATNPASVVRANLWHVFFHHWAFCVNIIDRMWFWQGKMTKFHFDHEGRHLLENRDGGALIVGSHLGSFDAMRALSDSRGVAINVVMFRSNAVNINRLFADLNPESNIRVIEMEPGDPNAMLLLQERVEAGELIALLADRLPPFGRPRYSLHNFLGKPAPFAHNPWILASLLGCPILSALCVRTGMRRYKVQVREFVDRVVLPRKSRAAALDEITGRYASFLQDASLRYPYQWFNFFDYWAPVEDASD